MKKAVSLMLVALLAMTFAVPVYAGAGDKFKDGVMTFVKSPLQIKNHVVEEYEATDAKPLGIIGGTFKGVFYMGKDMVTGLVKVLTFYIDNE